MELKDLVGKKVTFELVGITLTGLLDTYDMWLCVYWDGEHIGGCSTGHSRGKAEYDWSWAVSKGEYLAGESYVKNIRPAEDSCSTMPDITTPRMVSEDILVWAWDDLPEKADQYYLGIIRAIKDYKYDCWDDGKRGVEHGFIKTRLTSWKNISLTDPRPNKKKITLELTEEQLQKIKELLEEME